MAVIMGWNGGHGCTPKLVELNMENPLKMDDLGYSLLGNFHVLKP